MKKGTQVRMSDELKRKFILNGCGDHVDEFGECTGNVEGLVDYGNRVKGPEVDVRWQPSNLRYAYDPSDLVEV